MDGYSWTAVVSESNKWENEQNADVVSESVWVGTLAKGKTSFNII